MAIGSYLVKYFDSLLNYDESTASHFLSFYWGGAMFGRFIGAISFTDRKPIEKYLIMGSLTFIAVITTAVVMDVQTSLIILALTVGNVIAFQIGKSMPARTLATFAAMTRASFDGQRVRPFRRCPRPIRADVRSPPLSTAGENRHSRSIFDNSAPHAQLTSPHNE